MCMVSFCVELLAVELVMLFFCEIVIKKKKFDKMANSLWNSTKRPIQTPWKFANRLLCQVDVQNSQTCLYTCTWKFANRLLCRVEIYIYTWKFANMSFIGCWQPFNRKGRFLRVDDSTRPNPSVPELCKCASNFGRFVKFWFPIFNFKFSIF